jgi:hypothetical protein
MHVRCDNCFVTSRMPWVQAERDASSPVPVMVFEMRCLCPNCGIELVSWNTPVDLNPKEESVGA